MDERDAVELSESVYRRIHGSFVDLTLPVPIRAAAFRRNENETEDFRFSVPDSFSLKTRSRILIKSKQKTIKLRFLRSMTCEVSV
jgi:hypothetical protein